MKTWPNYKVRDCPSAAWTRGLGACRRNEPEGSGVDAVTLIGGRFEALTFEEVTEVTFALSADDFVANHAHAIVANHCNRLGAGGIVKGGPTAAGIELGFRGEEGGGATRADVGAGAFFLERIVGGRERSVGAGFAEHVKLLSGEALTPFGVGKSREIGHRQQGRAIYQIAQVARSELTTRSGLRGLGATPAGVEGGEEEEVEEGRGDEAAEDDEGHGAFDLVAGHVAFEDQG